MRLHPHRPDVLANPIAGRTTLDEILGRNAARNGALPALFWPDGTRQSWREVDAAVSALASAFMGWRLGEDAVVGVQLGSSAETAITCLALWRAGLTPAMLPLAWRRRELSAAVATVGASALVTRSGSGKLAETACEIAAERETIRFIGCFGPDAPDGATPLDGAMKGEPGGVLRADRPDDAADHVAVVTFEAGGAPVARSHNELLAAALSPLAAARLSTRASLVSTLDLGGLAGLATGLVPWLAACCAASFHQASSTLAFASLLEEFRASHLAIPGRIATELAVDGAFDPESLSAVMLVWRAPDGRAARVDLGARTLTVDVSLFGELGIYAAARTAPARFVALPIGQAGPDGFAPLIEIDVGREGHVAIRGPACPSARYPAEGAGLEFDEDGYLQTGVSGVGDRAAGRLSLGGRRRGVFQVGGLALAHSEVADAYRSTGSTPALRADPLFGVRVALGPRADGAVTDTSGVAAMLEASGFGPAFAPVEATAAPVRRTG